MKFRLLIVLLAIAFSSAIGQTVTGQVQFTTRLGGPALTYGLTDSAYVRVTDADRNTSASGLDTLSVRISSPKEPLGEKITLTETGVNTGIFNGWLRFDAAGAVAQDGFLQVNKGQKLTAAYRDPADDFGNILTVTTSSFYGLTVVPSGVQSGTTITWTQANSPYLLTGDITIPAGSKLVIQPGVEVRFKPISDDLSGGEDPNRIEIRVEGQLDAKGTVTDSIRFISNGDVPASGDWYGIVIYNPSSGSNVNGGNRLHMRHAVFSHYTQAVRNKSSQSYWGNTNSNDSLVVLRSRFISGGSALTCNDGTRPTVFSFNKLINCGIEDYSSWSRYKAFQFNTIKNSSSTTIVLNIRLRSETPTVSNFYIEDNNLENTRINISGAAYYSERTFIQRNTFNRSTGSGIYISRSNYYSTGTSDSVRYTLSDNLIRGIKGNYTTGEGIYLNVSSSPSNVTLQNNTIRGTRYGIFINSSQSSKAKILNNTIDSTYYEGLYLNRVSGKIQGNMITNSGWSDRWGIQLNSDFNYPALDSIVNNTISGNGNVNAPGNTITNPNRGGISINGHTTAVINNNNIFNNNSFDVVNLVNEAVVNQQNAKFNYWGTVTTATINTGSNPKNLIAIYDKYDDATKGFVNYGGYLSAAYPNGTPSSQSSTGQVQFTTRIGGPALTYGLTDSAYVRVTDADRNTSASGLDTLSVRISSPKEPLGEKITLTETGVNTGIFNGWLRFDAAGAVAQDGFLQVNKGQKLTAAYRDPADDFGNILTVTTSSFYGLTVVPSGVQSGTTITWTQANSPYLLTGDITIPAGSKLVIQPGVEVRFKPISDDLSGGEDPNRIEIRVEGQLDAKGTVTDSIRFISNGDVPASGDWYGIVIYNPSSGSNVNGGNRLHMRHAVFSHYTQAVRNKSSQSYWGNTNSNDSLVVLRSRFISGGSALTCNDGTRPTVFSFNKLINCGIEDYSSWSRYKAFQFNTIKNSSSTTIVLNIRLRSETPTVSNFYIEDNNLENTRINISGAAYYSERTFIQRNTFNRSTGSGIYISRSNYYSTGTSDSVRYTLSDNLIRGIKGNYTTGEGIYLNVSSSPSNVTLQNNTIRGTRYGIFINSSQSSKAKILNNTIDSTYYEGLYLNRVSGKIQGNMITNSGWSDRWGIQLNSDFNYPALDSIVNNTISGNGNVNAPGNTITNPNRGGISINGHTTAVINNNNIFNNNSFDVVNLVNEAVVNQQNAKFNYWGTVTTATINTDSNPKNLIAIYDKYDDATKGFVNYGGYLSAAYPNGTPSSQSSTGQVQFTTRIGGPALTYGLTDSAYVRVTDADRNTSASGLDTLSVRISSPKEPLGEKITLTETGVNTGIFNGWLRFDAAGAVAQDGFLQVNKGQKLTAAYRDPADDFGNILTVTTSSFYGLTVVPSGVQSGTTITWTQANSPYLLTGDITIPAGSKLVIQPGVEVRFKPISDDLSGGEDPNRIEIRVEGQLDAKGTVTDSIRFISNGDVPASGDWYGIVIYNPSSGSNVNGGNRLHMRHAVFSHYTQAVRNKSSQSYWGNTNSNDSLVVLRSRFISGGSALTCNDGTRPTVFSFNKLINCGIEDYSSWSRYKAFQFNTIKNSSSTTIVLNIRLRSETPTVSNFYIEDNNLENTRINISGAAYYSERTFIQRNTFNRSTGSGIYISRSNYYSTGTSDSVRYTLSDNLIRGIKGNYTTGEGIYLNVSSSPSNVTLQNNTIRGTRYGIFINSSQSSKAKILNNTIDSTYYEGLYLNRVSGKIQGNMITNSGWSDRWGIQLNSDFNYPALDSIVNNTISGNGNVNAPGNTITNPNRGGISINGHTTAVINNNNIFNNNSFDVVNLVNEAVVNQQNAKFNYWGTVTTATINTGSNPKNLIAIYDKYDDATKGFVNYGQNLANLICNPPAVNAGLDRTICQGQSVTLIGNGASTYTWSNGVSNGVAFNPTSSSTYTVTGTDAIGCTNTDQVTITVSPLPIVNAGTDLNVCIGSPVILSGSGASSYTWSNSVIDSVPFIATNSGTYTVTGFDNNGCSSSDQVSVTVNQLPTPVLQSSDLDLAICESEPISFYASGGSSYQFNVNGVSQSTQNAAIGVLNLNSMSSGDSVYVIVTDNIGCSRASNVLEITVNPLPTVSAGNDLTVCQGNSITLNATGAVTYQWTNGVTNGIAFTSTTSSNYIVTGTDSNGCQNSDTLQVFVTSAPSPLLITSDLDTTICDGDLVTLFATGAQSYSLLINGVVTQSISSSFGIISLSTLSNNDTLMLVGNSVGGCSANSNTLVFTVNSLPLVTAGQNFDLCQGSSTTLNASGASTYTWNNGVTNATAFTPTATTTYTVTGTDANGCVNVDSVTVTVNALPTVVAGSDVAVCAGTAVTLSGTGASTYTWNNGVSNATAFTPTATTTYTVTGTDANGCVNVDSVTVTVNAMPDTSVTVSGSMSFCPGGSVTLTAAAGLDYLWSTGDTTQSVTLTQAGGAYAVVTTTNGCVDTTATYSATLFAGADTTLSWTNLTFCASDSATITAVGGQSYLWSTGDTTQSITVNQTGDYTVMVTTINGCVGMSDTVSTTVVADVVLPLILGDLYGWFASGDTVSFSVANTGGYTLNWGVAGGQITAGQGTDTVEVIWGAADSTASVWVVVSNGVCQDSAYLNLVISGMGSGEALSPRAMAFPNPNSGIFTLEWSALEASQVVIYNGVGQMVATQVIAQGQSQVQVDLSAMAAGVYRAVIYGKEGQVTLPVQVRH